MGRKIFVSYKYADDNVQQLDYNLRTTVRTYVDKLVEKLKSRERGTEVHIYKGEEDDNDLSSFKADTIKSNLKDKIHDSSITIVLISPNMRERYTDERDQWIPWEISYSLKEITRNGKTSESNAMIAIVLPDINGSYNYYIEYIRGCNHYVIKTNSLFQMLSNNMFNMNSPNTSHCSHCGLPLYSDEPSYIISVRWQDFLNYPDANINHAVVIQARRKSYDITKEIPS